METTHPRLLLVIPPLTQLNTPYPATAYLKGFLRKQGIDAAQADLGIELVLRLFSPQGLQEVFALTAPHIAEASENAQRIYALRQDYIDTIGPVIDFLQLKDASLAHSICAEDFLPEASRFQTLEDVDWAFGTMGIMDRAKFLATLYLEDLGDYISELVSEHFGFSRYAERIALAATRFDPIAQELQTEAGLLDRYLCEQLETHIQACQPELIALTVPFPGNLYGALKCGQYVKQHHPHIRLVMGGGYCNTELRQLQDPRVFDYVDYITLDDGEGPLLRLLAHLRGEVGQQHLLRTYVCNAGAVEYVNFKPGVGAVVPHTEVGTPDYRGLPLDRYLSVVEIANPMQRLWNDGRWNKITVAHGCYWKKCSFCDVSLDYIGRYEQAPAALLVDRIEQIVAETGQRGFHLVDEAAPPMALRDLALELLRRGVKINWWGNIRFEKTFTPDLCRLLAAAGCIAVSGGIEVASDRLLKLMAKGVTIEQVARVTRAFAEAGIMVHAYLMYGFPTQTAQETIDSLEVVRQLFEQQCLHSGFWHRFTMTAHAPAGIDPAAYGVECTGPEFGGFAWNDLQHRDPKGADHARFGEGLRKAIFNYMHGLCMDYRADEWFEDMRVPRTTHSPHLIAAALSQPEPQDAEQEQTSPVWLGHMPQVRYTEVKKKGQLQRRALLTFLTRKSHLELPAPAPDAEWLLSVFAHFTPQGPGFMRMQQLAESYEQHTGRKWKDFLSSQLWQGLRKEGLLLVRL